MSPAAPIPFSRYSGFDRHGSSPIGAIAAAPISYRLIAKLRHRKLSAIGLRRPVLSLRHFRLARWCSKFIPSFAERAPKARARRISTGRLTRTRRLVDAAAADRRWSMVMSPAAPIPFSRYSGFDRHEDLADRSDRGGADELPGHRQGAASKAQRHRARHRALSPTFPAGAMVFFIPSRGGAEGSGAAHLDRQTDPHPPPG